jgi:hypothetical protein
MGKDLLADHSIHYNNPHIVRNRKDKASLNKIKFIKMTFFKMSMFDVFQLSAFIKYAIYYHQNLRDPLHVQ